MRMISFLSERLNIGTDALTALLSVAASSCFYLCLFAFLSRRRKKIEKRKEKKIIERQSVFTLPDRENSFVRDRLNTSLRYVSETDRTNLEEYDMERDQLRLSYVRSMLAKLKSAPLSVGDRLEVNGVSKKITLFALKNRITSEEMRELNDGFSLLLKMSAKYSL